MPSPTAVSELNRKKKRTKGGKSRKKENRRRGTINFFNAFGAPAKDDTKKAS